MKSALFPLLAIVALPLTTIAQNTRNVPVELLIEAFVDGPSTLHITEEGLYWTNGWASKPGRINAGNFPTVINEKEWTPKWIKNDDDRGQDRSDVFAIKVPTTEYTLDVLCISDRQGSSKTEKRTPPYLERKDGELRLQIPDPEAGAKWYKLKLKPAKKK